MEDITKKQVIAIERIESILSVKFEGSTKREAWEWMQEYTPKLKEYLFQKARSHESIRQLSSIGYESADEKTLRILEIIDENDPRKELITPENINQTVAIYHSLL